MLASLSQLLGQGRPLVGFTCYDLETGAAVLSAAERRGAPVVLLVSARSVASTTGVALVGGLAELVKAAPVPGCVQLDHINQIGAREHQALEAGAGAAMVDLSVSPVAENMAGTAEAVQAAKTLGVEVEGELGRLDGDEDQADDGACSSSFTDETEAVEFAGTTGVTCLAVAVGNRHGRYARRPALDFNLLSHLASAVGVPIALHGCSGMTEADLRTAIDCGVAKMNFNTDLRAAYFAALHEGLGKAGPALDLLGLKDGVIEAVAVAAGRLLGLVGWSPVGSSSAEVGGL